MRTTSFESEARIGTSGTDRPSGTEESNVVPINFPGREHVPPPRIPPTMLVVDDFATVARVIKTLAMRAGFGRVDVCHDGESALRQLAEYEYGYVICDLEMEPMDGTEFARRARERPGGDRCVILLTTASREWATRIAREGLMSRADGLLLKPFNSLDLKAKIEEINNRVSYAEKILR